MPHYNYDESWAPMQLQAAQTPVSATQTASLLSAIMNEAVEARKVQLQAEHMVHTHTHAARAAPTPS